MKGKKRKFDLNVSDWFWDIIDQFKQAPETVQSRLNAMTRQDLKRFYRQCEEATEELIPYDRDQKRGLDAEDLHELSAWVVSQGKDYYQRIWADPALLPKKKSVSLCNYAAVAASIYEERFGEEFF